MTPRAEENAAAARYQLALQWVKSKGPREAVEFLLRSMPAFTPQTFPRSSPLNGNDSVIHIGPSTKGDPNVLPRACISE